MSDTFKDYVADDLTSTFLNAEEFASAHTLDGIEVVCIVQDVNISDDMTTKVAGYAPDLYGDAKTINIRKEDLDEVPVYGQLVELDGERYEVINVADDMGMLTITVTGNRR